jgi:hypothetical protein
MNFVWLSEVVSLRRRLLFTPRKIFFLNTCSFSAPISFSNLRASIPTRQPRSSYHIPLESSAIFHTA